METRQELTRETLAMLQSLVQMNVDSRDGLREAVGQAENSAASHLCRELEAECDQQARELSALIEDSHQHAVTSGSLAAAVHRAWFDVRKSVAGNDVSLLSEVEQGERHLQQAYEHALTDHPGTAVADVLHRHLRNASFNHDRVRELRDRLGSV